MEKVKWDIVGISEVRREGEKMERKTNGNYFYYFGETRGHRGTGFFIKNSITNKVIAVKGITERISLVKLEIEKEANLCIIQVYAPTMEADERDVEEFYRILDETIQKEKEHHNIIMGDWNAKIGKGVGMDGVYGPYGIGENNENGERLIEFAASHNLKIANTFFNKKEKRKWTWMSPDSKTKNETDHLLINDTRIVQNVVCLRNFSFPSDHRIVRCTLKFPKRIRYKNYLKNSSQSEIKNIVPEHKKREANKYVEEQTSKFNERTDKLEVEKFYDEIEQVILEARKRYGKKGKTIKTDDKITEKTKSMIKERNRMMYKSHKTIRERIKLTELNKLIKREIKEDIRKFEEKRVKEIIEENNSTRRTRRELSEGKNLILELGNKINRKEIVEVATEFYKELYKKGINEIKNTKYSAINEEEVPPILKSEVEKAINELKSGKGSGSRQNR